MFSRFAHGFARRLLANTSIANRLLLKVYLVKGDSTSVEERNPLRICVELGRNHGEDFYVGSRQ